METVLLVSGIGLILFVLLRTLVRYVTEVKSIRDTLECIDEMKKYYEENIEKIGYQWKYDKCCQVRIKFEKLGVKIKPELFIEAVGDFKDIVRMINEDRKRDRGESSGGIITGSETFESL